MGIVSQFSHPNSPKGINKSSTPRPPASPANRQLHTEPGIAGHVVSQGRKQGSGGGCVTWTPGINTDTHVSAGCLSAAGLSVRIWMSWCRHCKPDHNMANIPTEGGWWRWLCAMGTNDTIQVLFNRAKSPSTEAKHIIRVEITVQSPPSRWHNAWRSSSQGTVGFVDL